VLVLLLLLVAAKVLRILSIAITGHNEPYSAILAVLRYLQLLLTAAPELLQLSPLLLEVDLLLLLRRRWRRRRLVIVVVLLLLLLLLLMEVVLLIRITELLLALVWGRAPPRAAQPVFAVSTFLH
jgi:hypothetical protein